MRRLLSSFVAFVVLVLSASAATGCSSVIRASATEGARGATPVVVDQSLVSFEDAHTRDRIARVLGSPEMQKALEGVAADFTRGALSDPATAERARLLTKALAQMLVELVKTELARAMSPEAMRAFRRAMAEAAASATRGATLALAQNANSLGPALGTAVANELNSSDMQSALRTTSQQIAEGAVAGSKEAFDQRRGNQPIPLLARVSRLLTLANIAVAVAIMAIPIALFMYWHKARRPPRAPPRGAEAPRPSRLWRPPPHPSWPGARLRT